MPQINISGINVDFPFEPYDLQKNYMEKVIECLENSGNGVLESPTGTGKTLCLLCSTLAWITTQKLQRRAAIQEKIAELEKYNQENGIKTESLPLLKNLATNFQDSNELGMSNPKAFNVPKVIYASRTHSQISQAMQELKRSSYRQMKAAVIGSRDQLCIQPDVMKEQSNANKIHMCKLKITTKTCSFYHKVEKSKDAPEFRNSPVLDIEDLIKAGQKLRCCPYFVSRELIEDADIIFMPYNYLLDPKARKANKVELNNTIVILDEAHNVERMCEDSASVQISSSEIAVCIDDVTHIMKAMNDNVDMGDDSKEFTLEDLVLLKEMLLSFEKAIDEILITSKEAGATFPGAYIFDLLGKANISTENVNILSALLDNLIQFLTTVAESNSFFRRGGGLQKLHDLLVIVFSSSSEDYRERVSKCYKVHVEIEEQKPTKGSLTSKDGWIQPKATTLIKNTAKILSYWCFSPGFGMQQLLGKNVRSVILTSGTLAPLKPLIAELAIPITVRLENPHIVTAAQVCVKVISQGPDKEPLLSNFENRNNPKYISSLGRTILSFCPVIPHGILVFFTSYFMLNKCRDSWQASGIWSQIQRHKPIYIEPQTKEAFIETMSEYYAKINDPITKGAIFLAVCRGKVSEGLDFADMNGRAVFITGLPFPPFKDPRVILKKKYLQDNRTRDNEMLSGDDWYFLEATRAVNQAIGRVIRHRHDYGAILLCDYRFNQPRQKNQLSSWIQGHLKQMQHQSFGPNIGDVARFFRNAERTLPQPGLKARIPEIELTFDSQIKKEPDFEQNTISYKFSNQPKAEIKNEPMKPLLSANSAFSWDMYKRPASSSTSTITSASGTNSSSTSDFLNRLNQHVTTINFNECDTESSPSTPNLVNIHKRERTSPLFNKTNTVTPAEYLAAKKRKFKIVPNDESISSFSNRVTQNTIESELSQLSRKTHDIDHSLPQDRKELLKLLKSSLSPPNYGIFIKSLTAYQKDNNLKELISAFLEIFEQPSFHYLFRGMRRFIKEDHKAEYDETIDTLI